MAERNNDLVAPARDQLRALPKDTRRLMSVADLPAARARYVPDKDTQEILLEEIKRQPEPVLIEVWHYLKFLTRQREEEAWADVLPSRQVEQKVLDHLDSK
jgi:hypothetical protein